jgi:hypothetical protein
MTRPRGYSGRRRTPVDWRFVVAISVVVAAAAGAIGIVIAILTH